MRRLFSIAILLAVVALHSSGFSAAPSLSGAALRIQVMQPDSAGPVEGASILVIDPQMSTFRRETRTDSTGRAEIFDLEPRDGYYLRVEKEAFQTHESTFETRSGEMTQKRVTLVRFGVPPGDGESRPQRRPGLAGGGSGAP